MKLIFILFTTFFTSFAYSSDLSGISDDQIRSVLLAALKRFHLKSMPVNAVSPCIYIDKVHETVDQSCMSRALEMFQISSHFHFIASSLPCFRAESQFKFESLPADSNINILDEFLDYKSLALLKTTNRHNSQIPDSFLFRRLTKFNPYYLVEDPIVNKLLLVIISKHFVKSRI